MASTTDLANAFSLQPVAAQPPTPLQRAANDLCLLLEGINGHFTDYDCKQRCIEIGAMLGGNVAAMHQMTANGATLYLVGLMLRARP